MVLENAPWHRGPWVREALAKYPHLELKYLPSYCPELNWVERFWKALRRRATHNRFFEAPRVMHRALRASIQCDQIMQHKLLSLIEAKPKAHAAKVSAS